MADSDDIDISPGPGAPDSGWERDGMVRFEGGTPVSNFRDPRAGVR